MAGPKLTESWRLSQFGELCLLLPPVNEKQQQMPTITNEANFEGVLLETLLGVAWKFFYKYSAHFGFYPSGPGLLSTIGKAELFKGNVLHLLTLVLTL